MQGQRIEDIYVFNTADASVRNKEWAIGAKENVKMRTFLFKVDESTNKTFRVKLDGKSVSSLSCVNKCVTFSEACIKIVDEPLVNVSDHVVRQMLSSEPVTEVSFSFDRGTDTVRIKNNGRGIPVVHHEEANMYVPSMIFGELWQGSNTLRNPDTILGGTNGLGVKITNLYSSSFTVETSDGQRTFKQTWRDRKMKTEEPLIVEEKSAPFTELTFSIDYSFLQGRKPDFGEVFEGILVYRYLMLMCYCNYITSLDKSLFDGKSYLHEVNQKKAACPSFYYKSVHIRNFSTLELAQSLFPNNKTVRTMIVPERTTSTKKSSYIYPWELTVVIAPDYEGDRCISNVNGVVVCEGGHYTALLSQICTVVIDKLKEDKTVDVKGLSRSAIQKKIVLLINAAVPCPSWDAQNKNRLKTDFRNFSHYKIDEGVLNELATLLAPLFNTKPIVVESFSPSLVDQRRKAKLMSKYRKAKFAGTSKSRECSLLLVEGDSALGNVVVGMNNKKSSMSFDYYGLLSTEGAIVNMRRNVSVTVKGNERMITWTEKAQRNVFMNVLFEVTGLDLHKNYDSEEQIKTLKYGRVIAVVDQDTDGKGKIFGLLLSMVHHLWPHLVARGFVKRMNTPIIRAYPRSGPPAVFYSQAEFDSWQRGVDVSKYDIRYYKGLSSHSKIEAKDMLSNPERNLLTYVMNKGSSEALQAYYGSDASKRKTLLSTPVKEFTHEMYEEQAKGRVKITDYLETDTKEYQIDDIDRKLFCFVDGFNQCSRKIFDNYQKKAASKNAQIKVAELVGYIIKNGVYHHGEMSLSKSVIGKGFVGVGANQVPVILPCSGFGTRLAGGKDAGQPRYVKCMYNKVMDIIYPREDYPLLEFKYEEGKRCEPNYFVPIIPMVLLQNVSTTAHGWNFDIYARDVFSVIGKVRLLVRMPDSFISEPSISQYKWTGKIKYIGGKECSVGTYLLEGNRLTITELPLRVWTNKYVSRLYEDMAKGDSVIKDIDNRSTDTDVLIVVKLVDGWEDMLRQLYKEVPTGVDLVEHHFNLYHSVVSRIYTTNTDRSVKYFDDFRAVIKAWFPYRVELYKRRINRQTILREAELVLLKNKLRFVNEGTLDMIRVDPDNELSKLGLVKINHRAIRDSKIAHEDQLRDMIFGEEANYDYIVNMGLRDMHVSSAIKIEKKIKEIEEELVTLSKIARERPFPGASLWLSALDALEVRVKEGMERGWIPDGA